MSSKRMRQCYKLVDKEREYTLEEAVDLLKACPSVKFDQTVEVALQTGVDSRKSDQQVRGTVPLPHGTGKSLRVLVFAKGEKLQEALDAGAEFAGGDDLVKQVMGGWTDFDAVVSTPDFMREVGKLGKVLGPRGLMPTPKAGTVTTDVAKAVKELKAGKVEFKANKVGVVDILVGKLSFNTSSLCENIRTLVKAIERSKPASAKGQFLRSLYISSTMGPGLKISSQEYIS